MNENENTNAVDLDDDGWADDIDLSDLSDETEGETDAAEPEQTEGETAESSNESDTPADQPEQTVEQPPQEEPEQTATGADQRFELKHLDERREVTLEEMKVLAQQGMDYARVREERDRLREYEGFLKELAGDGTVEELIDEARAAALSQKEGIDRKTAIGRVKLDRERKAFEAQKAKADAAKAEQTKADETAAEQKAAQERWRQDCFLAFSKEFPDVAPDKIPKDVWTAFQNGETLVSAYRGYRLRELEQEQKTKQQAEDAAKRSTGSQKTAGKSEMDEFDALWYDDDD